MRQYRIITRDITHHRVEECADMWHQNEVKWSTATIFSSFDQAQIWIDEQRVSSMILEEFEQDRADGLCEIWEWQ